MPDPVNKRVIAAFFAFAGALTVWPDTGWCQLATTDINGGPGALRPADIAPAESATVGSLEFKLSGIYVRTRPDVFLRTFRTQPGDPFDQDIFWHDVARLRNFQIFRDVTATVVPSAPSEVSITVTAEDIWTIIPIFEPSFGADTLLVIGGLRDANFVGRNHDLSVFAGVFRRSDSGRNDAVTRATTDFLFGVSYGTRQFLDRHSLQFAIQRTYGTDTVYNGRNAIAQFERVLAGGTASFVWKEFDYIQPGAFIGATHIRYGTVTDVTSGIPIPRESLAAEPGLLLRVGKVDYDNFRVTGNDLHVTLSGPIRSRGPRGYVSGIIVGRQYFLPHPRINLAARGRLQARNNDHIVDDITWGGFAQVRGYPSDFLRGQYGVLLNVESRFVLFEQLFKAFYGEAAVFYDAGAMGSGRFLSDLSDRGHSLGIGLRGSITKIFSTFFRADVALPLTDPGLGPDINIGVRQFF